MMQAVSFIAVPRCIHIRRGVNVDILFCRASCARSVNPDCLILGPQPAIAINRQVLRGPNSAFESRTAEIGRTQIRKPVKFVVRPFDNRGNRTSGNPWVGCGSYERGNFSVCKCRSPVSGISDNKGRDSNFCAVKTFSHFSKQRVLAGTENI